MSKTWAEKVKHKGGKNQCRKRASRKQERQGNIHWRQQGERIFEKNLHITATPNESGKKKKAGEKEPRYGGWEGICVWNQEKKNSLNLGGTRQTAKQTGKKKKVRQKKGNVLPQTERTSDEGYK